MSKIQQMITEELQRARIKFPQPLNSPHEGYAVLLEEVEELIDEIDFLKEHISDLWQAVKSNNNDVQLDELRRSRERIDNIITEAVQVGAMIEKYQQDVLKCI